MPKHYTTEDFADILGKRSWFKKFYFKFSYLILLKNQTINQFLKKWIKKKNDNLHVLDAGFGFGTNFDLFQHQNNRISVLGIDKNEKLISVSNEFIYSNNIKNIFCKTIDIQELDFDSAFDLCLSINLLNYVENDELALKNFYNALKKNGMLFVFNSSEFVSKNDIKINKGSYHDEIFRNGYSKDEIVSKLRKVGFSKVRIKYAYGTFGVYSWWLSTGIPTKLIKTSILFYLIMPLYALIVIPFIIVLNILDIKIEHKSGKCIIVKAIKYLL